MAAVCHILFDKQNARGDGRTRPKLIPRQQVADSSQFISGSVAMETDWRLYWLELGRQTRRARPRPRSWVEVVWIITSILHKHATWLNDFIVISR